MRVTVAVPLYVNQSRVGAWIATHELLKGLVERGHDVTVVPTVIDQRKPTIVDGVRVVSQAELPRSVLASSVVVSHLGDHGTTHALAVQLSKPSVRLVHGQPVRARGLDGAALAVCNSNATAKLLRRWNGAKVVVHPPTDPERYRTTPGECVTLVNLSSAKGGPLFWSIADLMPDVKFLGVRGGHGSQTNHVNPNVEVIESTEDMRDEVYARTRLLLMPSQHEAWGMVGVEAIASGIPVLARPLEGIVEALEVAGNWQHARHPKPWVADIMRLLEPTAWSEASARALARSAEMDPAAERAKFADALEDVVARKGRR